MFPLITLNKINRINQIPVVGSVANMMAYADRQNAERRAGLIGELGKARKRESWE